MYKGPLDVQSLSACPYLDLFCLSFHFRLPPVSFPLSDAFSRPDFYASQEAGETSESTLIYPNEWLSNLAHPSGTDAIPESKEEKERERDRWRAVWCVKRKKKEKEKYESQRFERTRAKTERWALESTRVWLTLLSRRAEEGRAGDKYSRMSFQRPEKLFLMHFPSFLQSSTPWKQYAGPVEPQQMHSRIKTHTLPIVHHCAEL